MNLKEVLKDLNTVSAVPRDGDVYVFLDGNFELRLGVGTTTGEHRVLVPSAKEKLLERLDAEIRVPGEGDSILSVRLGDWISAGHNWSTPAICKKKPKPELRKLEPGEPVMPGDAWVDSSGKLWPANSHYMASSHTGGPRYQGETPVNYQREPWTTEEYQQHQKEWVEFHNLKPGDTVKVCCKAEYGQDGWQNSWISKMDCAVGETFTMRSINARSGLSLSNPNLEDADGMCFPFYVLQVVRKPEPKYREFRTTKEVLTWVQEHGQFVIRENGDWATVTQCSSGRSGIFMTPGHTESTYKEWKSVKDGTPFGVQE